MKRPGLIIFISLYAATVFSAVSRNDSTGSRTDRLYPVPILRYAPETRLEYGLAAYYGFFMHPEDSANRSSSLNLSISYTQNKQSELYFSSNTWSKNNTWHLLQELSIIDYPYYFYGTGNETREADRKLLTNKRFRIKSEAERKLISQFYAGADLQYQHDRFSGDPDILQTIDEKGLAGGNIILGGLSLSYDSRDHVTSTTRGNYVKINGGCSPGALSAYNFTRILFQSRSFITKGRHTLGAHILAESLQGDFPFYELRLMGGSSMMRGYYRGRFRDQHYVAGQAEYRIRFLRRFSAAVFGGTGMVFNQHSFVWSGFKPDYGGGLRYCLDRRSKLTFRVDYGIGEKNEGEDRIGGIYFGISEAF